MSRLYTNTLLRRDPFLQRPFTREPFHALTSLRTEQLLHRDPSLQNPFCKVGFTESQLHTHAHTHTRTHAHTHTRTQRRSNTEQLLQTDSFTQATFYTEHILDTHTHKHRLLTETALHRGPATQRPLYTETLFTERPFVHTDELLHKDPFIHAEAFTQSRFYTQRRLYRVASTGDPSRHRAGLTHTHTGFYTETLLHRHIQRPFGIQRPFHTQTRLRTEQLLHRDPCRETLFLHRSFSASKNFLHRDPGAHGSFCTETPLHMKAFTQRPFKTEAVAQRPY